MTSWLLWCGYLLLSLGFCSWAGTMTATAAEDTGPFAAVVEHELANGMKVLLLKESRAPLISVQIWYKVGSRHEQLGKTGLSHLTEHLMFKGTAKYGPKEFSRVVQRAGGTDNAFTSRDYTAYFQNGPQSQLKLWLTMEADRMRGLKVTEEAFRTEQQVVLEERRLRTEDDPVSFLLEEIKAAAYKAHPYQWPVIGWYHDIESLRLEDFQQYYERYYQPNNATLVVVGDIDPQEAITLVEQTFGRIPRGPEPPAVTAREPQQHGERRVVVQREAELPYVVLAYHVPNWRSPECFPLEVLAALLSQGKSSRLYHRLVYRDRLALEAGADYDLDTADPSLFLLYGQPLPGKTALQVEKALLAEITNLQSEPPGEQELRKVKNQLTASFYMSLDSLFFRGMLLGRLATTARWTLVREYIAKIEAVEAAAVCQVARKYLVGENRTVGVLKPLKSDRPKESRYKAGDYIQ